MKGYMTLQEMAARLDLKSPDSLRRQIQRGVLTAEKVGSGPHAIWLVSEGECQRYERERKGKRGFASPDYPRPPRKGE